MSISGFGSDVASPPPNSLQMVLAAQSNLTALMSELRPIIEVLQGAAGAHPRSHPLLPHAKELARTIADAIGQVGPYLAPQVVERANALCQELEKLVTDRS